MIVMILTLKIICVVVAIFAFSTTISFQSTSSFMVKCNTHSKTFSFDYSYPFDLTTVGVHDPLCNNTGTKKFVDLGPSEASPAEFYVCVGVMAFLYCIAALILYICFDDLYRKNSALVLMDFVISVVLTTLWLISSCAWAQGVTDIKYYTDPYESGYFKFFTDCGTNNCTDKTLGNFTSLNMSIIFGFLNFLVWSGHLWFLYKETPWFKIRPKPPGTPGMLSETEPQKV